MSQLTKITFHGNLAEALGKKHFELKIDNVAEGLRAVDIVSKRKLSKAILENEKQNIKYKILTDEKPLFTEDIDEVEKVVDSELFINKNYKTIDIVPVLEGAGDDAKDRFGSRWSLMFGIGLNGKLNHDDDWSVCVFNGYE